MRLVHLERLGCLPEEVIRFYVAQLSSALQFLHDNNIMHRHVTRPLLSSKHNPFSTAISSQITYFSMSGETLT